MFSRDVRGCLRKRVSVDVGWCCVLWLLSFLYVYYVFENVFCTYSDAYTYLVQCVLVLRCGAVVSVCRLKHYWSVQVECGCWVLMTVWNRVSFFLGSALE